MPIYEFLCEPCETRFEALMPLGSVACTCPHCEREASKLLSAFNARTAAKSKAAANKTLRKERPQVKLPDDVARPGFELGPPPPLPKRYVHQLKHHGHC